MLGALLVLAVYVGVTTNYMVGAQGRASDAAGQRQQQIDIAIEGISKLTELQSGLCAYADASQDWALLITDINAPETLRQIADPELRQRIIDTQAKLRELDIKLVDCELAGG